MPRWFPDPQRERQAVTYHNARRDDARREVEAYTPRQVAFVHAVARALPWSRPGVVLGVAKGLETGAVSPNVVEQAGRLSAKERAARPGGGRPYGAKVTGRQLTPGVWRLIEDDMSRDPLRSAGIVDPQGALARPTPKRYRDGAWSYDSVGDEVRDRQWRQTMEAIAAKQGTADPIPFTQEGKPHLFFPKTGRTSTLEAGAARLGPDLPGGVDEWVEQANASVKDWVLSRRIPQAPGSPAEMQGPQSVTDVVRTAGMVGNAGYQELQGQVRNVYAATHGEPTDFWQPQSDYLISFQNPDMGSGTGLTVDPESEVAAERRRREVERGEIDGHTVTWGRWAASAVTEPGTGPYNVLSGLWDAGLAIVADPTAIGLGKVAKAREAALVFTAGDDAARAATGLLSGVRKGVDGPTAQAWLDGPVGSKVVDWLAGETSPAEIWRQTNRRLEPRQLARLADANTPEAVRQTLTPMLGTTFRTTKDVWKDPTTLLGVPRPSAKTRRLLSLVPAQRIDLDDPIDPMRQVERWLQNAHVPDDVTVGYVNRLARAENRNQVYDIVTDAMSTTDGMLASNGIGSASLRSRLTRLERNTHRDARAWTVDEVGNPKSPWTDVMVGGETVEGFPPHLLNEHLGRYLNLPDYREVRKLTSRYPNLTKLAPDPETPLGTAVRFPASALGAVQDWLWKPVTLLRMAWPVRVVGEEQLRMAAAGYDSMFAHPLSYISWAIGRRKAGKGDVLGTAFDEAESFRSAMTRKTGGWLDDTATPGRVRTGNRTVYRRTPHEMPEFVRAWTSELTKLHLDPVAWQVARGDNLDDVETWFTREGGQGFLRELTDAHPELAEPGAARRYLETVQGRIHAATGGNGDLLDAVRSGRLNGKRIVGDDELVPTGDFRKALDQTYLDSAPDAVVGEDFVALGRDNVAARGWRRTTETMFSLLMSKPTNALSRSETFRQAYWRRINELIGFASSEARNQIVERATAAGLGKRKLRGMSRGVKTPGTLTVDEVDFLAKAHGLDEVKTLLYSMTERHQIADSMRLVFPFGEAWGEVLTRWARLANPASARGLRNLRRGQQALQGAFGEGFGEVIGAPEGEGFFFPDEWGEPRFWYPGSSWFMAHAPGGPHLPIPLAGRVQGLSMFGTVMPGVGPVLGVPIDVFLPDKPGIGRTLRESLIPFGTPFSEEDEGAVTQLLNYAPPWARRAYQAWTGGGYDAESDRLWGNAVMSTMTYLMSTGDYDNSRADHQRLVEDATKAAPGLYLIRGLASFGAPSAPAPDFVVETNDGAMRLAALRDEYYALRDDDFETADAIFLDRWGPDLAAVMQPMSREVTPGVKPTRRFEDWRRRNGGLLKLLPTTGALFGPQEDDQFDYAAYQRQFAEGERQALKPDQWLNLVEDRLGWMAHDRYAGQTDPASDDDRAWLRRMDAQIAELYPGWKNRSGLMEAADPETMVAELVAFADNPKVARTDAGKGLKLYLGYRSQAQEAAEAMDLASFRTAKASEGDRAWLRKMADKVIGEHPGFAPLWERVFSQEMADDTE